MEDSMDMDNIAPLRPQNFLFGCELKADKKEYSFKVEDDENEHQLSLRTVSLGASAKDELHVVEAEGINYEGKTIKIALASLKPSVQPTVSLGGFEITPPVILRLKSGSGPVYVSGQHLVALEDLESSDDEDEEHEPSPKNAKRIAPDSASKVPRKKTRLEEEEEDSDEDDDDDDEDDDDEDDDEEEEETPVKKTDSTKSKAAQKLNHNGKASALSTTQKTPKTPEQKGKQDTKPQTPKTPKTPLSSEEIKAKMQTYLEKGNVLPKVEVKFANYVKNCFRTENQKVIEDLWKWRQSLKDGK
ncbi:nucleophosmin [Xenopus laevis]|uniref:Nucleophosmin n=1 Tax=Xenopus laevis TaxID=8355 RepID=Q7ZTP6_XENLA|nr:nucleophosmin [Xenopus laevis]AAH43908.1 Npm1 protein [Xenopus laevis]